MNSDQALAKLADPNLGQHFLVAPDKIAAILDAAQIQSTDSVIELGAGAGTVARAFPPCARLTLVELDKRLIPLISRNVPRVSAVLQADALRVVREVPCDVLIANLPTVVTERLIRILPELSFRTAVFAVGASSDLDQVGPEFAWREVARISGDDFIPPQESVSRVIRFSHASS